MKFDGAAGFDSTLRFGGELSGTSAACRAATAAFFFFTPIAIYARLLRACPLCRLLGVFLPFQCGRCSALFAGVRELMHAANLRERLRRVSRSCMQAQRSVIREFV
eukprot:3413902-Pleurochrysis_carterae.AAC.4